MHHVGTLVLSSNIRVVRTLPAPALRLGDVNGDGIIDVTDVVLLASYVMGDHPTPFYIEVADLNDDGIIDVTDVVLDAEIAMGS